MYQQIYETISELLFGALPASTSFEALFTTGASGALCLGVLLIPYAVLLAVTRLFMGGFR